MPAVLIFIYCFLIALSSLFGGWLPALVRLTHTRMQLIMSFVGGLMLGVALLHMLPHAFHELGSIDYAVGATVIGLLAMFCMIRILHVHQHSHDDAIADLDDHHDCEHDHAAPADQDPVPGGEHESHDHAHNLSWVGLFAGLAIHTLIDGVALASGVAAGLAEGSKPGTSLCALLTHDVAGIGASSLDLLLLGHFDPLLQSLVGLVLVFHRNLLPLGVRVVLTLTCP